MLHIPVHHGGDASCLCTITFTMSLNPARKSKGATSLVSRKSTAFNVLDVANDELDLLANREATSTNRGHPGRKTKRSASIIEDSSEDEEDKSSTSDPDESSDDESGKDNRVVVPSSSTLITPPRTGEKRKRGSKNSE